jgi:hypothetical protein
METTLAGAAQQVISQWGAPGAIIAILTGLIGYLFKTFASERKEMRDSHASERNDMREVAKQRHEQVMAITQQQLHQAQATEQVLRELTGAIGEIKAQTRHNT